MKIPLHKPWIDQDDCEAVLETLRSGRLCGNGPVSTAVERRMEARFNVKHAMLTTSCTHAMELALMALEVEPGDEVIMPGFSFVSTANAVVLQGATPVFVDIEEEYYTIDPAAVERALSKRTKGIICVHYAGVGCDMSSLSQLAQRHNIFLLEDAAHAIGSRYDGQALGTIGDVGCFSFHETKNLTCGEGGALLTNRADVGYTAEIMREKGTNRAAFMRGDIDKYTWVARGSSYILSDILAAMLSVQLRKLDEITRRRLTVCRRYMEHLQPLGEREIIRLPSWPNTRGFNGHIFAIRMPDAQAQKQVIHSLRERGIGAAFHFVPLHTAPYAMQHFRYRPDHLPITERVSETLVRLPVYPDLTEDEQTYIIDALYDIIG